VVECGPGKVLAGMTKRIDAELTGAAAVRPGHAGRGQGPGGLTPDEARRPPHDRHGIRRPGGPGHRRFARHWRGDRAELAARGLKVIGTATTDEGAARIGAALAAYPGCRGAALDVNDAAAAEALIDAIVKEHGALHVLVNNAGITRDMLAMRLKDEDWDAVLDTNLKAVFRLSARRHAPDDEAAPWPHHQHHQRGRRLGQPRPGQLRRRQGRRGRHDARAGARAGQPRHHRQLRGAGLHRHRHDRRAGRRAAKSAGGQIPLGRLGQPADIAAAVAYLASPEAGYVTGQELHVNGGMFMA
jgi:3-oxoacyl-[acyl-carrier protein] reductase